jgi:hypothetical protein
MKFGIHNSSWLERIDPGEAFEAVKAKAHVVTHPELRARHEINARFGG